MTVNMFTRRVYQTDENFKVENCFLLYSKYFFLLSSSLNDILPNILDTYDGLCWSAMTMVLHDPSHFKFKCYKQKRIHIQKANVKVESRACIYNKL